LSQILFEQTDTKTLLKFESIFVQLGFPSDRVMPDKKSSSILIYLYKDTEIYAENIGIDQK
jgi:hypothetical protein